jgi:hypothetical protein
MTSAVLALGACTAPVPELGLRDLGSRIAVFGPDPGFDPAHPADDWYRARRPGRGQTGFSLAEKDGVLALRLETEGSGSLLGRRITAPLLAMPYLRWGWHLESAPEQRAGRLLPDRPAGAAVPLYLFVAFHGGADAESIASGQLDGWFRARRPRFDRAFVLGWSGATFTPAGLDPASIPPRYVLREGLTDAGKWMVETVDLAQLYARLWPRDRIGDSRVVFIAAGGGPTKHRSVGYVAEVVLSR